MSNNEMMPYDGLSNHAIMIDPRWESDDYLFRKDEIHRISQYAHWLTRSQGAWYSPDLQTYVDYLSNDHEIVDPRTQVTKAVDGLSASSIQSHIYSIIGRYKKLLKSNDVRDLLYQGYPGGGNESDRKAWVDEILTRLQNSIQSVELPKVIKMQDLADDSHVRLSPKQAQDLLGMPDLETPKGLRDAAIIAMLLSTGIREAELANLRVGDLRRKYGGRNALQIRKGKGAKQRMVVYGDLEDCLIYVGAWVRHAGIDMRDSEIFVFRGFFRGYTKIRKTPITPRAVQDILSDYHLSDEFGFPIDVRPHDLRRTYARLSHDAGMDLVAIQQNLGHADIKTTLRYIGSLDADQRATPSLFNFAQLEKLRGKS